MSQSKTLIELKKSFEMRLQIIYSKREAENISNLALMHILNLKTKADFILNAQTNVGQDKIDLCYSWLSELEKGKPIQHLIEQVEFDGLSLKVNKSVLIPRPETEELVYLIKELEDKNLSGKAIDIGTGSGCIPLSIKNHFPKLEVFGLDVSENALAVAEENSSANGLQVTWLLLDFINEDVNHLGKFDLIVSNPPYIPISEKTLMDGNVVDYEPHIALFTPDNDPLLFYRRILEFATEHLNNKGSIYFELHENFAKASLALAKTFFSDSFLRKDLQGKNRFLVCNKEI